MGTTESVFADNRLSSSPALAGDRMTKTNNGNFLAGSTNMPPFDNSEIELNSASSFSDFVVKKDGNRKVEFLESKSFGVSHVIEDVFEKLAPLSPSFLDQFSELYRNGLTEISEQANRVLIKPVVKKAFYIKPALTLDFNQIATPYDEVYGNSGYAQQKVGIGGGMLFGKKVGDISVETGFIYSSKKYSPKEFIEIFIPDNADENTFYSFEKIHLNTLSIPLQLSYEFDKNGRWNSYVSTGAAMHMALQANYETKKLPFPRFAPYPDNANITRGETPKFDEKAFEDGIIEGGSFRENHYFTLNLGAGLEYKLSGNVSLYAQPTFYYNVFNKGLGPNNDKIHTLSLNVGSKITIGK